MITNLQSWLERVAVASSAQRQHALAVQSLMLGMLGTVLAILVLGVILSGGVALNARSLVPTLTVFVGIVACIYVLRRGRVFLSVGLVTVLVIAAVTWGLMRTGVAESNSLTLFLIPLLLAGFMLSRKGLLAVAGLILAIPAAVTLVQAPGMTEGDIQAATIRIVRFAVVVALFALFTDRHGTAMRRALHEAENQQRLLQERVQERTGDLERANQQLREANERLELANQELESFSYSVSHDLRAPLRAIAGFSQVIREDYRQQLDERGRHYLERIEVGAEKMSLLIDDFLVLSRISRTEARPVEVDLSEVAREAAAEVGKLYGFRFETEDRLTARGDRRLLYTLLLNLIENGAKYAMTQAEPRVRFYGARAGECTSYVVADNGVGFDMAYAERLFVPFQRLHGSQFEGNGIGLATVQRIVRRHGGRVWAESVPGKGARFSFTLNEGPSVD